MSWRDVSAPIIERVLARHGRGSPELRKALRAAYPFGERKHWPYKVWLAEIQRQVGRRNPDRKTGELFPTEKE